jgi:hypothetical protein
MRPLRGPHALVTSANSLCSGEDNLIYCGIDWAEKTHDVALVDDTGQLLAKRRITDVRSAVGSCWTCSPSTAKPKRIRFRLPSRCPTACW